MKRKERKLEDDEDIDWEHDEFSFNPETLPGWAKIWLNDKGFPKRWKIGDLTDKQKWDLRWFRAYLDLDRKGLVHIFYDGELQISVTDAGVRWVENRLETGMKYLFGEVNKDG